MSRSILRFALDEDQCGASFCKRINMYLEIRGWSYKKCTTNITVNEILRDSFSDAHEIVSNHRNNVLQNNVIIMFRRKKELDFSLVNHDKYMVFAKIFSFYAPPRPWTLE